MNFISESLQHISPNICREIRELNLDSAIEKYKIMENDNTIWICLSLEKIPYQKLSHVNLGTIDQSDY